MSDSEQEPIEGELLLAPRLESEYEHQEDNLGGRPRYYETPAQFDEAVNAYYQAVMKDPFEPLTLTGLVLHMGFSGIASFENYAAYDGFLASVTRAKTLIKYGYEKSVLLSKNSAAARILGAMDQQFNPTVKIDPNAVAERHEDRLEHLR